MDLRSAVHELTALSQTTLEDRPGSMARGLLWAGFLALVVAGPWLLPGYLFGTDWPGPRHFALPTALESSAPLEVALAGASLLLGGEATGKVFVLGLLFVAGWLAYLALPRGGFLPRAAAASLYVLNPLVYGRLHYGQLFLLGAYAAFPWVAIKLRALLQRPSLAASLLAALGFALVGIFSLHVFLMTWLLAAVLFGVHVLTARGRAAYLRRSGAWLVLAAAAAVLASAFWLVPLLIGQGTDAAVIAGTGAGDLSAYAAVPDRSLGLVPNLLGLYGFWAENSGRFTSMKAFVPVWPAILAVLLVVAAVGAVVAIRDRRDTLALWVIGLLIAGSLALALEMGISNPATAGLVGWLDAHVVLYRGMRDAGKWAVLLAFVYSQLVGLGTAATLARLKTAVRNPIRAQWVGGTAAGLLLALPLYYGNGLLFGAHGEIKPSLYPSGWYAADRVLAADQHPARALFLPWHEYMSYSFVRNRNNVVAAPAPSFFSVPVLVSSNPEVRGVVPPTSSDQAAISNLVRAGDTGRWAQVLADHGVKYILLAHELDWSAYGYLDSKPGLVKVGDYGSISLYQVSPP